MTQKTLTYRLLIPVWGTNGVFFCLQQPCWWLEEGQKIKGYKESGGYKTHHAAASSYMSVYSAEQGFHLFIHIVGGEAQFLIEHLVGSRETETVETPH